MQTFLEKYMCVYIGVSVGGRQHNSPHKTQSPLLQVKLESTKKKREYEDECHKVCCAPDLCWSCVRQCWRKAAR